MQASANNGGNACMRMMGFTCGRFRIDFGEMGSILIYCGLHGIDYGVLNKG